MGTLFISYSSRDRPTADVVYNKLLELGYEGPFRDDHPNSGIPAGSRWESELYRKLRLCRGMIVLVSKNWLDSKWCFAELTHAKSHGKSIFPILIDDAFAVPAEMSEWQGIRLSDPDIWQRLEEGLEKADLAPDNDFPWPVDGLPDCPYPGLSSFEAHHAGIYFGRDKEIQELRERFSQMANRGQPRLLYVIGASGSGKSSLVKAGLLPRLARQGCEHWLVLPTFRWNQLMARGRDWQEQLAVDLANCWPVNHEMQPTWRTLYGQLRLEIPECVVSFVDATKDLLSALRTTEATPVLVIDQFEEVLGDPGDEAARCFLKFLSCLILFPKSPWRVIVTVRTDFLEAIQTDPDLAACRDQVAQFPVYLTRPECISDIIRRPAHKVGIQFESDGLVDRIVRDTATSDALPLLAFAMREMYEHCHQTEHYRQTNVITEESYERIGRIEGCLARVADGAFNDHSDGGNVTDQEREHLLHLVFSSHLVSINDEDQFVRRTARWNDLPEPVRPLLQRFVDRRLITSRLRDESDPKSERVIEVAHEALFRRWDKLVRWLNNRRDLLHWRVDVARDRLNSGERWTGLTPTQLGMARHWPQTRRDELATDELNWIRRAKNAELGRRLLIAASIAIAILAGVAVWFAFDAVLARHRAERSTRVAEGTSWLERSAAFVNEGQFLAAKLAAMRAISFDQFGGSADDKQLERRLEPDSAEYRRAVERIALMPEVNIVYRFYSFHQPKHLSSPEITFGPTGASVVTVAGQTATRLDFSGSKLERYRLPLDPQQTASTPAGIVAIDSGHYILRDWRGVMAGGPFSLPKEDQHSAYCLVPKRGRVAFLNIGTRAGRLQLLSPASGASEIEIKVPEESLFSTENDEAQGIHGIVAALAKPIVAATLKMNYLTSLVVFDLEKARAYDVDKRGISEDDPGFGSVCVSDDGSRLFVASGEGEVWRYSLTAKGRSYAITGKSRLADTKISNLTVSPNGAVVAFNVGSRVSMWNPESGQIVATLTGHESDVSSIAFDPSGRFLATVSDDGMTIVWDVPTSSAGRMVEAAPQTQLNRDAVKEQGSDFLRSRIEAEGQSCLSDDQTLGAVWDKRHVLAGLGDDFDQVTVQVFDMQTRKRTIYQQVAMKNAGEIKELRFTPACRFVIAKTGEGEFHVPVFRPRRGIDYMTAYHGVEVNENGLVLPRLTDENAVWHLPPELLKYTFDSPEGALLVDDR